MDNKRKTVITMKTGLEIREESNKDVDELLEAITLVSLVTVEIWVIVITDGEALLVESVEKGLRGLPNLAKKRSLWPLVLT